MLASYISEKLEYDEGPLRFKQKHVCRENRVN